MSNIVISVENISKSYRLGQIGTGTLSRDLEIWFSRIRGKPNPFLKIGQIDSQDINSEEIWALLNVSFQVKQGEVFGIVGRNGAGKSTLLKILSRITSPSEGMVKVKGRIASLLEVGTGFHPELTGRENIFINGAILGMTKQEVNKRFDEIVSFAEIEKFVNTPVKRYSSGMYVRLAFAVAAHLEAEILLIDEVLAVGDLEFQQKCIGKMDEVSKGGRTVLFVSHNMGLISQLCEKSILLKKGKLEKIGDTKEVIDYYLKNENYSNLGIVEFPLDKKKMAQLISLRLLNSQRNISSRFSCDEPIVIELKIFVNKSSKGMYCWLDISKTDGTLVMMSDSFDSIPNPLDDLPYGESTIHVTIPPRSLGHGDYLINLIFTGIGGSKSPIDRPGIVIGFQLDDVGSKRGNKRPGFFSTMLRWEIKNQT